MPQNGRSSATARNSKQKNHTPCLTTREVERAKINRNGPVTGTTQAKLWYEECEVRSRWVTAGCCAIGHSWGLRQAEPQVVPGGLVRTLVSDRQKQEPDEDRLADRAPRRATAITSVIASPPVQVSDRQRPREPTRAASRGAGCPRQARNDLGRPCEAADHIKPECDL